MELRGVNVVPVLVSGSIMQLRPDLLQWRGTLVYPVRSGGSHLLWFEATAHRCGGEMPDHIGRKGGVDGAPHHRDRSGNDGAWNCPGYGDSRHPDGAL